MKKTFVLIAVVIAAGAAIVSCGSSNSSSNQPRLSGLKFRALVSNPLAPSAIGNLPVLNIVDASKDQMSRASVSLLGVVSQAGLMAVSSDLRLTLVFSPAGNSVVVIDNSTESVAASAGGNTTVRPITLPGVTESMFVAKDNVNAYAAVPSAAVTAQAPGAVVAMNLATGSVTATIPVPAAHFIVPSPDGDHILAFSDNSDAITVITTSLIGTNEDPRTVVGGFDRPVWGIFNDTTTAYIFNCGRECRGKAAGIALFDLGTATASTVVPLGAATYGLLNGSTLYVAGTPPNTSCGKAGTSCGTLNIVDVDSMKVTNPSPILITDGYHDRMQMGANGRLFVGASGCTGAGCLAIVDTNSSKVVVPAQPGDVTGIAPIPGRDVVYVCQGGIFKIYDTTTDQPLVQPTGSIDVVGQPVDVKVVDPPPS